MYTGLSEIPPLPTITDTERREFINEVERKRALLYDFQEEKFLTAKSAAVSGDLQNLKKCIVNNPTLATACDFFGRNLYLYSILANQKNCVQWLLSGSVGVGADAKDRSGWTALHWAVHKGHFGFVKSLLSTSDGDPLIGDVDGVTPLHLAVKSKCIEILVDYLNKINKLNAVVSLLDSLGRSTLHWAAALGRLPDLLRLIKDKVRITLEETDKESRTLLMWSVMARDSGTGAVDYLLQKAARLINCQDNNGYSALHFAVMMDNVAAIDRLLACRNCDPNVIDKAQRTPLHWAARLGRLEAIARLLSGGAKMLKDANGATPLHYAAQNDFAEATRLILMSVHDDYEDDRSRTSFMWSAAAGAINTVETMLDCIEIDCEQKDKGSCTALHLAACNGRDVVITVLLENGWSVDAIDRQGKTPLLMAAEYGHSSTVQLLLKYGSVIWHKDSNGRTALHWASLGGHAFVCQLLIRFGLGVDVTDQYGRTPMHYAAFGGFNGCISVLIQANGTPSHFDNQGAAPLHLCAAEGHLEVCRTLLNHSTIINAVFTDERGNRKTPYDMALEHRRLPVAQFLLHSGAVTFENLIQMAAVKLQAWFRGCVVRKQLKMSRRVKLPA